MSSFIKRVAALNNHPNREAVTDAVAGTAAFATMGAVVGAFTGTVVGTICNAVPQLDPVNNVPGQALFGAGVGAMSGIAAIGPVPFAVVATTATAAMWAYSFEKQGYSQRWTASPPSVVTVFK